MLTHLGGWLFLAECWLFAKIARQQQKNDDPKASSTGNSTSCCTCGGGQKQKELAFCAKELGVFRVGGCNLGFSHNLTWDPTSIQSNESNGNPFPKMVALSLGRCFSKTGFGYFCEEFEARKKGILHHGHIHHYRPLLWRLMTIHPPSIVF